jgi:hypothetical protein
MREKRGENGRRIRKWMWLGVAYLGIIRMHQAQVKKHKARVGERVCRHGCEVEVGVSYLEGCR